jgi:hypothetical protein
LYSKHQNTVEPSTFGSEFNAMKTAVEQVEALCYMLRMMGVPIDGPASIYCDNQLVFKNASRPESMCNKKLNSIAYHHTREAQAAETVHMAWESGESNLSDLFTKLLPGPHLHDLYEQDPLLRVDCYLTQNELDPSFRFLIFL